VLTAVQDFSLGASVTSSDFREQWVNAFEGASDALETFPSDGPYVTATALRAGQPLYQSALRRPIAVRPGDAITVLVRNGPVTLRTSLIAQSQASVGDTATAVNPLTDTPVVVTVTGPERAEMVLQ